MCREIMRILCLYFGAFWGDSVFIGNLHIHLLTQTHKHTPTRTQKHLLCVFACASVHESVYVCLCLCVCVCGWVCVFGLVCSGVWRLHLRVFVILIYRFCTSTSERRQRKEAQYVGVYTTLVMPANKKLSVNSYEKFMFRYLLCDYEYRLAWIWLWNNCKAGSISFCLSLALLLLLSPSVCISPICSLAPGLTSLLWMPSSSLLFSFSCTQCTWSMAKLQVQGIQAVLSKHVPWVLAVSIDHTDHRPIYQPSHCLPLAWNRW